MLLGDGPADREPTGRSSLRNSLPQQAQATQGAGGEGIGEQDYLIPMHPRMAPRSAICCCCARDNCEAALSPRDWQHSTAPPFSERAVLQSYRIVTHAPILLGRHLRPEQWATAAVVVQRSDRLGWEPFLARCDELGLHVDLAPVTGLQEGLSYVVEWDPAYVLCVVSP